MKENTLYKTNLFVCAVILIGFSAISIISYCSNFSVFQKDIEMVSTLSSESLYREISTIFSQPVNVSLTMANDNLLKSFLRDENMGQADTVWHNNMRKYLDGYRLKYDYDSIFLVSCSTNRYYHFKGHNRTLTQDETKDEWYYRLMASDEEYSLNVDEDQMTDDKITVFVNCKIKDDSGSILGIVGVGLQVNSLQALLLRYEEKYKVQACLINSNGVVELSSGTTGREKTNLFDLAGFADNKKSILENRNTPETFWYSSDNNNGYVVTQYEPNLKWHLVVEKNTSNASRQFHLQLFSNMLIIAAIIIVVLLIITFMVKQYNIRILELTISQELEYQKLLRETTNGLYEDIFELDITHNCAGGESTRKYFESLGLSADAPYNEALHVIAEKQIKPEYVQGYLDTFSPNAVMESFQNGIHYLTYDFMISENRIDYHWIRISARIFFWNSDQSVRMITYRLNTDAEKKRELMLLDGIRRDAMTELFNKRATEELITDVLNSSVLADNSHFAFLMFDIDNFKTINDTKGHIFGDHVISEFANELKTQFQENDIVGRIGGDEFVVLMMNIENLEELKQKLTRLCRRFGHKDFGEGEHLSISCSIGVALFPVDGTMYSELYEKADQALYHAKSHGKNSFVFFNQCADSYSFHTNQRDMEALMNAASDGMAQYACTDPVTLLYYNQKCIELFGVPADILSSPDYNPMGQIHPDDVKEVCNGLKNAFREKQSFTRIFRIRHFDGHYMSIMAKGIFISDLYKNQYPIFYVMYLKQEPLNN